MLGIQNVRPHAFVIGYIYTFGSNSGPKDWGGGVELETAKNWFTPYTSSGDFPFVK